MIEKIQEFLLSFGHFNIDYLSGQVSGMSVYPGAYSPVVKSYAGGGKLYRYSFWVEITSPYACDVNGNSHMIIDEFVSFIRRKNSKRQLPVLGEDMIAQSIEVKEYLGRVNSTPNKANFKVKLELLYTKVSC